MKGAVSFFESWEIRSTLISHLLSIFIMKILIEGSFEKKNTKEVYFTHIKPNKLRKNHNYTEKTTQADFYHQ